LCLQKDHLIQLHAFLIQIRSYIETIYEEEDSNAFTSYDALSIHPHEVHKSKDLQRIAIFELTKGISELLTDKDPTRFQKISETLDYYCEYLKKKKKE